MKDFLKSRQFQILVLVGALLFSFLLRGVYTGGLAPFLSSAGGAAMVPLNYIGAKISAAMQGQFGPFLHAGEVAEENLALRSEVQELREKLIDYETVKTENGQFRELLEIKERNKDFIFEPATVVGRSPDDAFGAFTIDVGSYHGITLRAPVITSDGLVGIVSEVGYSYSKVQTLLDVSVNVGGLDIHTLDTGMVTGSIPLAAQGRCKLGFLPRESGAAPGDIIVTSGVGGLLPKGLVVGEIESIATETSGLSLYGVIKPVADLSGAKQVFVIKDFSGKDGEMTASKP